MEGSRDLGEVRGDIFEDNLYDVGDLEESVILRSQPAKAILEVTGGERSVRDSDRA